MVIETLADHTKIRSTTIRDLLIQLQQHDTPLRIENDAETYYVLRVDHLKALLEMLPPDLDNNREFTLQDFGLNAADLKAYQQRRDARRKRLDISQQNRLEDTLLSRLEQANQSSTPTSAATQEETLRELEAKMLYNLQAALSLSPTA